MSYNTEPVRNYVRLNLSSTSSSVGPKNGGDSGDISADLRVKLQERDKTIQDLQTRLAILEKEKQETERQNNQLCTQLERERYSVYQTTDIQRQLLDTEQRLQSALSSIEELRKELDVETLEHNNTRRKLREVASKSHVSDNTLSDNRVSDNRGVEDVESLAARVRELEQDRERLLGQVEEYEQIKVGLEVENNELKEQLLNAQQQTGAAAAVAVPSLPAPPPPPPPPPPPVPPSTTQPFLKIRKSVSCSDVSGKKDEKPIVKTYEQAMAEMMTRIKSGKTLRSTPTKQLSAQSDAEDEEEPETCRLKQLENCLRPRQHSVGGLLGDDLFKPNKSLRFCTPQHLPSDEYVQPIEAQSPMRLTASKENIDPLIQRANHCSVAFKQTPPTQQVTNPAPAFNTLRACPSPSPAFNTRDNPTPNPAFNTLRACPSPSPAFNTRNSPSSNSAFSTLRACPSPKSAFDTHQDSPSSNIQRACPSPYSAFNTLRDSPSSHSAYTDTPPVRPTHNSIVYNNTPPTNQTPSSSFSSDTLPARQPPTIVVSPATRKPVIHLKTVEPKVLVWDHEGSTTRGGGHPAVSELPPRSGHASVDQRGVAECEGERREGGMERGSELHKVFRQRGLSVRQEKNMK